MTSRVAPRGWRRALTGALVSGITGLVVWMAGRDLPLPRTGSSQAVARWYAASGPVLAVFSVGRVVLIVSSAVMAVAFLCLSLALARWPGQGLTRRILMARRVPGVGAVLRVAIGLSATGAAVAACGSSPPGMSAIPAGPPAAPVLANTGPPPMGRAHRSPPPASPPTPRPASPASPPHPPASRPAAAPQGWPAPPAARAGWVVRPGDSLWSIAEATVGGPPERVAAYWARLVRANRPTLPDPADPSLLFPGDVVLLPPRQESPG